MAHNPLYDALDRNVKELRFGKLLVEFDVHHGTVTAWTILESRPRMTVGDTKRKDNLVE